jgi:hypothetical protein
MLELERAKLRGQVINYRVSRAPDFPQLHEDHGVNGFDWGEDIRCYRVWDGFVRGWTRVLSVERRGSREVRRVPSDPLARVPGFEFWLPGTYIVCDPEWTSCRWVEQPGFRGWRWFDRTAVGD